MKRQAAMQVQGEGPLQPPTQPKTACDPRMDVKSRTKRRSLPLRPLKDGWGGRV